MVLKPYHLKISDTDVQMPNAELGNMKVKVRTSSNNSTIDVFNSIFNKLSASAFCF